MLHSSQVCLEYSFQFCEERETLWLIAGTFLKGNKTTPRRPFNVFNSACHFFSFFFCQCVKIFVFFTWKNLDRVSERNEWYNPQHFFFCKYVTRRRETSILKQVKMVIIVIIAERDFHFVLQGLIVVVQRNWRPTDRYNKCLPNHQRN